mmetsp:Transcript_34506/g.107423  ORF Transcript_34506/g.107423 Transcript_34506/m.107423 type:complete len:232 (-) Transcript_34506:113-808(-)
MPATTTATPVAGATWVLPPSSGHSTFARPPSSPLGAGSGAWVASPASSRRLLPAQDPTSPGGETPVGHPRMQTVQYSRAFRMAFFGGEASPSQARRYVLRPARVVRAVEEAATPGGSQPLCASREHLESEEAPLLARETCAICLELLQAGETVQPMVRCRHLFHETCVREFLEARRRDDSPQAGAGLPLGARLSCPLCRGRLAASSLSEVPEPERGAVVPLEDGSVGTLER